MTTQTFSPTDPAVIKTCDFAAFGKLSPKTQLRNPVMFVVYIGSSITSIFWLQSLFQPSGDQAWFIFAISAWLWFTVLFANFAESMAEGRGKAQAEHLKSSRRDTMAKKLLSANDRARYKSIASTELRMGDYIVSRRVNLSPAMGRSLKVSPRSMKAPSRENPRRSSVNPAATVIR